MPFYEYECQNCKFYTELMQKISDPPLAKCPSCGKKALKKLVSAPVFRLKGGGWYETDFKSDKENKRNLAGADKEEAKAETKAETKTEAKAEAKGDGKGLRRVADPTATWWITLRRYMVAGVLVWLPILVTIWVVSFMLHIMDRTLLLLPTSWRPQALVGFALPGAGLVFALIVVFLTGLLVTNLIGRRLIDWGED